MASCDERSAYLPAEIEARNRLREASRLDSEADLRGQLGMPTCVVSRGGNQGELVAQCPEGAAPTALKLQSRETWPDVLRKLPSRTVSARVLVYTDFTVIGYYYVDDKGSVEFTSISVS